ncbi:MAG: NAD+ synthase [Actinobacteria bacterium]|nr:NAD+ synthase [Actinomycetota bacterium]
MRLALSQLNPLVGDVAGNTTAIHEAYRAGVAAGARVVVTGELALTGYPPEDLVLKPAFVDAVGDALRDLAAQVGDVPLVAGFVERLPEERSPSWRPVASEATTYPALGNAAAVLRDGRVEGVYRKRRLPNYGVFDEARYFRAGTGCLTFEVDGIRLGVTICEDLWGEGGPVQDTVAEGARVVLNLNASPYSRGKRAERERWAGHHARAGGVWLVWLNQVGGQDEVVFDGDSLVMGPDGTVRARGAQFAGDLVVVDVLDASGPGPTDPPRLGPVAEVYAALVLGTRDYVRKNGFDGVLVGVSGGVDSALTTAVAVDALGADAVTAVAMPSPHTSPESSRDVKELIRALGCRGMELPIEAVMRAFDAALSEPFQGTEAGVAEENLQSRIRGTLLMALSNKFGQLVLATGNKSESAVGYATLYGDMAGGYAPIKDVPKTLVYELCRHRNEAGPAIPPAVIHKAPTAELRPGQLDTDALPDYATLDPVLELYVEQDRPVGEIVAAGYDERTVREVARLVDRAEYKRRQAPPGIKITARAFGKDRRLPITQAWSG